MVRFGKRSKSWAAASRRLNGNGNGHADASAALAEAGESSGLLEPGDEEESMDPSPQPEAMIAGDPTQRLLTALGRFQRQVAKAESGAPQDSWTDDCMAQLITGIEIALNQGWQNVQRALTDTARILQSYEDAGVAVDAVDFLQDSYEILCLMVGDIIVDNVRSGVMQKWDLRYKQAVCDLDAAGLALVEDDTASESQAAIPAIAPDNARADEDAESASLFDMPGDDTAAEEIEDYESAALMESIVDDGSDPEYESGLPEQPDTDFETELFDAELDAEEAAVATEAEDTPEAEAEQPLFQEDVAEQAGVQADSEFSELEESSAEELVEEAPEQVADFEPELEDGLEDAEERTLEIEAESTESAQEVMESEEAREDLAADLKETEATGEMDTEEDAVGEAEEELCEEEAPAEVTGQEQLDLETATTDTQAEVSAPALDVDSPETMMRFAQEAMAKGDVGGAKRYALQVAINMAALEVKNAERTLREAEEQLRLNGHAIELAQEEAARTEKQLQDVEWHQGERNTEHELHHEEIEDLRGEIALIEGAISDLQAQIRALEEKRENERRRLSGVHSALEESLSEERRIQNELDGLSNSETVAREALEQARQRVSELQRQHGAMEKTIEAHRDALAQRRRAVAEIEQLSKLGMPAAPGADDMLF